MPIADVARTDVMTAHRDQSAGNLATVMKEQNVGSVLIESDNEPVGIVTDRDLVVDVLEPRADPSEVTAADIMSDTVATVYETQGIFEVTAMMLGHSVRRLPVVAESGEITGIVTLDDLMLLLADEMSNLAGVIEAETPPY